MREKLSTPFWEFLDVAYPLRLIDRIASTAFYSLLGVSVRVLAPETEDKASFAAFYSLLGVSVFAEPQCNVHEPLLRLSTPFWEFLKWYKSLLPEDVFETFYSLLGVSGGLGELFTGLTSGSLSTPFWEFLDDRTYGALEVIASQNFLLPFGSF